MLEGSVFNTEILHSSTGKSLVIAISVAVVWIKFINNDQESPPKLWPWNCHLSCLFSPSFFYHNWFLALTGQGASSSSRSDSLFLEYNAQTFISMIPSPPLSLLVSAHKGFPWASIPYFFLFLQILSPFNMWCHYLSLLSFLSKLDCKMHENGEYFLSLVPWTVVTHILHTW